MPADSACRFLTGTKQLRLLGFSEVAVFMAFSSPRLCAALICCAVCATRAETVFPGPGWKDRPNPLASPAALTGGEIAVFAGQYPKSFNYYLDNNVLSAEIFGAMYETLLGNDPMTAEYEPGLASKWSISDDKKTFTFRLDERARWSDGRPVTAEDVKWTFDAIMDPRNLTGVHKVSLEKFESPLVLESNTVRFTTSEVHWRNLGAAGGFSILPKHVFADADFNKINFEFPVVSGPYRLGELRESIFARLERRPEWWAGTRARYRHTANFKTVTFRFFAERENAFEAFKKGQIDIFPVYTSRIWVNETRGEKFLKNWIVKQKVANYRPIGFQGFAMNMRRPPFDDRRVRTAMAHLVDRERMNRTIMYNQYFMHRSYYEDLYSPENPCRNPYFEFDKEKARRLLEEAGWRADPATGILEKDGRNLTFRFLTRDPSSEKFLSIFAEDLKDVGVALTIDKKDWAAWSRDMDEFNFDMTWAAWGAGLFKDPEGMWASKEADRRGGSNITGFKNERVDEFIEKQKSIFDVGARHEICREIDAIVAADCPYVLLWNISSVRLLYWNKFGTPPTVLSRFGSERDAYWYWWYEPDNAADLKQAVQEGEYLPPYEPLVKFDDAFR